MEMRLKRGSRLGQPAMSQEVYSKLSDANVAFVQEEHDKAIHLYRELIRIEPGIAQVWRSLAVCHEEKNRIEEKEDNGTVLQLNIMAAHLEPPDAARWRELGVESRWDLNNKALTHPFPHFFLQEIEGLSASDLLL